MDKTIKIWDLRLHTCIQTFTNEVHQRPENFFSSIIYNPNGRGVIVIGSNQLQSYRLANKEVKKETPRSHEQPIRGLLYNPVFNQIVSGCDEGIINVWEANNGIKTFRFEKAHGNSEITGKILS